MIEGVQRFAFFFFFNDTATTEIYTLSLHDALPISACACPSKTMLSEICVRRPVFATMLVMRSEEHTSELQSQSNLVCRLLLEKKKKTQIHKSQNFSACLVLLLSIVGRCLHTHFTIR